MVDPSKKLDLSEELEGLIAIAKLKGLRGNKVLGSKYATRFKHGIARELAVKLDTDSSGGTADHDEKILERLAGIR